MENLSKTVIDFVKSNNVCASGIATVETLAGGPPSTDLTYVLPNAKSAISFAVPLNQDVILDFLSKKDRWGHHDDNLRTNALATGIALQLSDFLNQLGHPSVPVSANAVFRTDTPMGGVDLYPPISHRYLAVRSGVGHFGCSGNVITKSEGACVILASVVTEAELIPTDPLPDDENYCNKCGLCTESCTSGYVYIKEKERVTLGGIEFTYGKRKDLNLCGYVCGGFAGLHPSGKWSTWSPGRFPMPKDDAKIMDLMVEDFAVQSMRPENEGGYYVCLSGDHKFYFTCGNCQLICVPDPKERKKRYQMLINSGVVIQHSDGSLERVAPEKAKRYTANMDPETRALYEKF